MARILPLSPDVISGIQSSKQITSLQGVALSLLENSLDAASSKIEISVNFRRGGCTIEDNGTGIYSAEFLQSGGLGNMYHTSKQVSTGNGDLHGSTGTYLASLSALSLLSITAKHEASSVSATLTLHQGKVIARQIPASQVDELTLSPSHGARLIVRDLFGNMPVRVKQRALSADSGADDERAWQELKSGIVALLLAWPKPCSVKIFDVNVESRRLQLSAQHPSISQNLTEKSLNQVTGGKTKFELKDVLPTLFQSQLAPPESRASWVPLSAASTSISIKGFICLDPAPSKGCQFISLGVHPCEVKNGYADVYNTVNQIFLNSSFGASEDDSVEVDDKEKDRRARDRRFKQDGFTRKQTQGRKGVDRWSMFVLQVKFKDWSDRRDILSDRNLKAVTDILEAAVREWLAAHHFRPGKKRQRKGTIGGQSLGSVSSRTDSGSVTPVADTESALPTSIGSKGSALKKRKVLDSTGKLRTLDREPNELVRPRSGDFSTWSRIKSGRHRFYDQIWEDNKPHSAPEGRTGSVTARVQPKKLPFTLTPLQAGELSLRKKPIDCDPATTPRSQSEKTPDVDDSRMPTSDDFGSVDDAAMLQAADDETSPIAQDDAIVEWTDPKSNQTYQVNARTGIVLPTRSRSDHASSKATTQNAPPSRNAAAIDTTHTSAGLPLLLSKRPHTANRAQNQWLSGFLKEWDNPVFGRQNEEPIPVASLDGPGIEVEEFANRKCSHHTSALQFDRTSESGTRKLSKAALTEAKVVRQVDKKFILCKVREGEDEVLVLIDQHAASERVILEQLLDELCAPVDKETFQTTGSIVKTVQLEKPLRVMIPPGEFDLFKVQTSHFAEWGILYDLRQRTEVLNASQVRAAKEEHTIVVRSLPPGIAERCALFPKLLIELLRSEIWSVSSRPKQSHGHAQKPNHMSPRDGEEVIYCPWVTRSGSCPKGILEMLNSRACRSAIMFNDELSIGQCEELLRQLSKCVFPFMCAHGRVSMVPLAELGRMEMTNYNASMRTNDDVDNRGHGIAMAFSQWIGTKSSVDSNETILD